MKIQYLDPGSIPVVSTNGKRIPQGVRFPLAASHRHRLRQSPGTLSPTTLRRPQIIRITPVINGYLIRIRLRCPCYRQAESVRETVRIRLVQDMCNQECISGKTSLPQSVRPAMIRRQSEGAAGRKLQLAANRNMPRKENCCFARVRTGRRNCGRIRRADNDVLIRIFCVRRI